MSTEVMVQGAIRIFAYSRKTVDALSAILFLPLIGQNTAAESRVFNDEMLKQQFGTLIPQRNPGRIAFAKRDQAARILQNVMDNPVASLDNYDTYDPKDTGMGFCFGRAMAVHIEALALGIEKDKIKKIWALGDLRANLDPRGWSHHVTTAIQGEGGVWWAIDPIMGEVVTVNEWYERMKKMNPDGKLHLFVSSAKMFNLGAVRKYNKNDLAYENFNGYFKDLMAVFRDEASQVIAERKYQADLTSRAQLARARRASQKI